MATKSKENRLTEAETMSVRTKPREATVSSVIKLASATQPTLRLDKRKKSSTTASVKGLEHKLKREWNSSGEESDVEDGTVSKTKIPKNASSTSVIELAFDKKRTHRYATRTQQRKDTPSGSGDEDATVGTSTQHKYGLSTERMKILPSQIQIESMWAEHKSTAKEGELEQAFHTYCDEICKFIKNIDDNILSVWPAYTTNEANKIYFVVETKEKQQELTDVDYSIYLRTVDHQSNEDKEASQHSKAKYTMLKYKELKHIQEIINNHATDLFKHHSQLSLISGSGFRSKGFNELDKSNHKMIPGKTIVMYVKIKGKVPLHEEMLPTELDGIPVDVREGKVKTSATFNATDTLPNLRMGCQIASHDKAGTLGAFIHHPKYGLCGITCAHCVLSVAELNRLDDEFRGKKIWEDEEKIVRQPGNGTRVGRVTETYFKRSAGGRDGVDLAVFQIEERPPNSGRFPTIQGAEIGMVYESGKMCEKSPFLLSRKVRKFGFATELTEGVVVDEGASTRLSYGDGDENQLHLKVIHVRSSETGVFCSDGDSGALVFQTGVGRDLVCVGMLIGTMNGDAVVTPISEVKKELGISEFESFRWNSLKESLDLLNTQNGK